MIYFWVTLLIILNAFWLILVLFGLPGNWLMIISACSLTWWRYDDGIFSVPVIVIVVILAVIGEIVEFFAGMTGAKKAGASWFGSMAAIIGSIAGAFFGTFLIPLPIIGTLFGACCGAAVGTIGVELLCGKDLHESFRFGLGAGVGDLIGKTGKFIIGLGIWLIIAVSAYWP